MVVKNIMESIAYNLFEEFQKRHKLKCSCDQCKGNILAIVLNHIPPYYVSSELGELYIKSQYMNEQLQLDLIREITKATALVEERPRHNKV